MAGYQMPVIDRFIDYNPILAKECSHELACTPSYTFLKPISTKNNQYLQVSSKPKIHNELYADDLNCGLVKTSLCV